MPKITMVFGLLLCGLPVLTMILTGGLPSSITAYIPMFVGVPLLILGMVAAVSEGARKHAMHAAAALGLLGGLAALGRGVPKAIEIVQGKEVDLLATSMVWAMILICITFVFVCVESFISARRARLAGTASSEAGNSLNKQGE
jgi:uncharacterized membrane protein